MIENLQQHILNYKKNPDDSETFKLIKKEMEIVLKSIVSKYNIPSYEKDDLYSVGIFTLHNAILSYDESNSTTFKYYFNKCFENNLIKIYHSQNTKALNKCVPLESDDGEQDYSLQFNFKQKEDLIKEVELKLDINYYSGLTDFERCIVEDLVKGLKQVEMSIKYNVSTDVIHYNIKKIRKKLDYLILN